MNVLRRLWKDKMDIYRWVETVEGGITRQKEVLVHEGIKCHYSKGSLSDVGEDGVPSFIDRIVLEKAGNEGLETAKELTNVSKGGNIVEFYTRSGEYVRFTTKTSRVGGKMKEAWYTTPTKKTAQGVEKEMGNTRHYAPYVNYEHVIRNKKDGPIKGFVKGQFMLEKAVNEVEKQLVKEFKKEVERVNRKHDK
ncbi:MAG: HK97 gp10 family phage protein [Caldicoprobacterales bacterium]